MKTDEINHNVDEDRQVSKQLFSSIYQYLTDLSVPIAQDLRTLIPSACGDAYDGVCRPV